jgi:general secretion pathway protein K
MSMADQRGIALASVLWTVTLLALIAASFASSMRAHGTVAASAAEREAGQALADAGIALGILELLSARPTAGWRRDGTPHSATFAGHPLIVSIQDEAGKIDLNTADDELLLGLFRSVGLGASQADALRDALLDWRDEDDLRHLHGAEAPDYRSAGYSYGPRNGVFHAIDELQLILGMTASLYKKLEPALTVHAMRRGIDPATAPVAVLRALPAMTKARIEQEMARRDAAAREGTVIAESLAGRAYMLRSEWRDRNGRGAVRSAIVRVTDDPAQPYWIQDWKTE